MIKIEQKNISEFKPIVITITELDEAIFLRDLIGQSSASDRIEMAQYKKCPQTWDVEERTTHEIYKQLSEMGLGNSTLRLK